MRTDNSRQVLGMQQKHINELVQTEKISNVRFQAHGIVEQDLEMVSANQGYD